MDPAHPTPEQEAEALLSRLADGDDTVFGRLVELESPRVTARIANKLPAHLRRRVGASDIAQEAAARLAHHRDRFENQGLPAFRQLLNTIADNLLVNTIEFQKAAKRDIARERRPRPEAGASQVTDGLGRLASPQSTPSKKLMRGEDAARVQEAFTTLSAPDQEIIQLVDYDGLDMDAVARALELSINAARQRHSRAIRRLRAIVDAESP